MEIFLVLGSPLLGGVPFGDGTPGTSLDKFAAPWEHHVMNRPFLPPPAPTTSQAMTVRPQP